jgi:quercetin dioxygenase-like cupin family protein
MLAALRYIPETQPRQGTFDLAGALTSTVGMSALVYGIVRAATSGWGETLTVSVLAAGVILLALFAFVETRARQPIVPLRLFASRERTGAYLARLLYLGAMMGRMRLATSRYHCLSNERKKMKLLTATVISLSLGASACAQTSGAGAVPGPQTLSITRGGSQPSSKGPADYFTGSVRVDPLFPANSPSRASGGYVTFEPGARSAWHTHPFGQTLIVTAGVGRVQRWGGAVEEIRAGDVVWTPPGVKHWHGAAPDSAMTHIAVQEHLDGKVVEWMEKVSDGQYNKLP